MSPITAKVVTVVIFVATYILLVIFYSRKTVIVWAAAGILLLTRAISPHAALSSIDWNVVLLYFGMLFVSEVFLFSKMPDYLATALASRAKRTRTAMVLLCVFSGFLSVFLENVAVVLLVAPIALGISRKCNINPVPLFTGMAISANLQGAATLIGDPPSMLLAGFAKLSFNDFFIVDGKPSIFFAVQVGAIVSAIVLSRLFRKYDGEMPRLPRGEYGSLVPTVLLVLLVGSLVANPHFDHGISYMTGLLCCVFGALGFGWYLWHERGRNTAAFMSKLDWQTGVFLMGIFILVESLSEVGVTADIAHLIMRISGRNPFIIFMLVVWVSVALSAFIDNIPFLMAMLPVVQMSVEQTGANPYALYFGLLLGASVGGNITPIGASGNIVAMAIVRRQGHTVRFFDFVRIGLPFTVAAVLASTLFVWFVFR